MTLAIVATIVAWANVLVGIALAVLAVARKRVPGGLAWLHPIGAVATLVLAWWAAVVLPGTEPNVLFNSGAFVLTLAVVAGSFLGWVRWMGAPPLLVLIILHGLAGILGAGLLTAGLMHGMA